MSRHEAACATLRPMAEIMRNGLSLWRWNRWFQVRVIRRWHLRHRWPKPRDIERMTDAEREAWFESIGLDERIAVAVHEWEKERDQRRTVDLVPEQEGPTRRASADRP